MKIEKQLFGLLTKPDYYNRPFVRIGRGNWQLLFLGFALELKAFGFCLWVDLPRLHCYKIN